MGLSVAEVADTTANRRADVMGGWVFDGENIVKRVYTEEELKAQAETEKAKRLAFANKKTQAWQSQLMLGMIGEEDKQSLIAWMEYVKQVQAIDTSAAPDIAWPEQPA
nr:tail fiber assembly protein [Serratia marcescens]